MLKTYDGNTTETQFGPTVFLTGGHWNGKWGHISNWFQYTNSNHVPLKYWHANVCQQKSH